MHRIESGYYHSDRRCRFPREMLLPIDSNGVPGRLDWAAPILNQVDPVTSVHGSHPANREARINHLESK